MSRKMIALAILLGLAVIALGVVSCNVNSPDNSSSTASGTPVPDIDDDGRPGITVPRTITPAPTIPTTPAPTTTVRNDDEDDETTTTSRRPPSTAPTTTRPPRTTTVRTTPPRTTAPAPQVEAPPPVAAAPAPVPAPAPVAPLSNSCQQNNVPGPGEASCPANPFVSPPQSNPGLSDVSSSGSATAPQG